MIDRYIVFPRCETASTRPGWRIALSSPPRDCKKKLKARLRQSGLLLITPIVGCVRRISCLVAPCRLEPNAKAGSGYSYGIDVCKLSKFVDRLLQPWIDDLEIGRDVEPLRDRDVVIHLDRVFVLQA